MATQAHRTRAIRTAPYVSPTDPTIYAPSPGRNGGRPISKVPYLPGLDGLRALAVAAVMVYHANSEWLPGGFLGVEVFFVISGYLITLLLISERERTGRIDFGQFWLRRARRLLPALFVMMFLLVTYTALFRSDALGELRGDVVAGLFYVSNWYQVFVGAGYTAAGDFAPLRHLWSLAVEEQFYLVWPVVMAALLKVGPRRIAGTAKWLVVAVLGITVVTALAHHSGPIGECDVTPAAYWTVGDRCISKADALYLLTPTRAGGVLIGAALAMLWRPAAIMRGPLRDKGRLMDLLAVVGIVALAAMTWTMHFVTPEGADPWLFRGGFLMCGLATVFVIAAVTHRHSFAGPVLGNPVFLWAGTRSYGLYLYHWPIYQVIREVAGNPLTFNQFAVAMVVTAVVTELSYRFVETPIRRGLVGVWWRNVRRSPDPTPRQTVLLGGAVAIALGLFSGVSLATAELKPNEVEQSIEAGRDAVVDLEDLIGTETAAPDVTEPVDSVAAPVTDADAAPATDPVVAGTTAPGAAAAPATAPPVETTTTTTTTTTIPAARVEVLAIGDSVMLGAAEQLTGYGITTNAEVSRQGVDGAEMLRQLNEAGVLGRSVVIHLGTNGTLSQETLDAMMAHVTAVPRVVVLTARVNRGWTAANNERIRALPNTYANVVVLDWETIGNECVDDCYANDGIHLNSDGRKFYAKEVVDAVNGTGRFAPAG